MTYHIVLFYRQLSQPNDGVDATTRLNFEGICTEDEPDDDDVRCLFERNSADDALLRSCIV